MCGFSGFLTKNFPGNAQIIIEKMGLSLAHRGPDDSGFFIDKENGIAFSHRRLSIVDLSNAGHQPMHSISGRYIIIYNGEIYNHLKIRSTLNKLDSVQWRGYTDTETLLNAFEIWGIQETVKRCIGMFAFSVWDNEKKVLTLCRDRVGEKPLYYGWQGNAFLFGSELKALHYHPSFENKIDRNVVEKYIYLNHVPAPYSIYENIYKLLPGTILTISLEKPEPKIEHYWSAIEVMTQERQIIYSGSAADRLNDLDLLLKDAVKQQMMGDMPVGAFLSGGVDSSMIVAMMQSQSMQPIKTFTIGFHEETYNEAKYAKQVAHHLGTDHTELYVSPKDALNIIPKLVHVYDEPFADSSQIPTMLVSRLASRHVRVCLTGDGGDELFCGYSRYRLLNKLKNIIRRFPIQFCQTFLSRFFLLAHQFFPLNLKAKLQKVELLMLTQDTDFYYQALSCWPLTDPIVLSVKGFSKKFSDTAKQASFDFLHFMMMTDMLSYLPDDILVKIDRAAMYYSLETRVPFLDHRVIEFAWNLPISMKLKKKESKWLLRQLLYRYVPRALIERPKMGFQVPINVWLQNSLKPWAENLLDESRLHEQGFFSVPLIRQIWKDHSLGKIDRQYVLWNILVFQAWLENERI